MLHPLKLKNTSVSNEAEEITPLGSFIASKMRINGFKTMYALISNIFFIYTCVTCS